MREMTVDDAVKTLRSILKFMVLNPGDTGMVRVAKVAFGVSAITMLASVATVALASPGAQLEAI